MSNTIERPPYIKLLIFTSAVSLIIYVVNYYKPDLVYVHIHLVMVFFYFTFLISYFIIQLSFSNGDPRKSVIIHLGAVVARMLMAILAAFIFLRFDPENQRQFVGNFLVIYLCYIGFEIYSLLSNLRPDLKSKV